MSNKLKLIPYKTLAEWDLSALWRRDRPVHPVMNRPLRLPEQPHAPHKPEPPELLLLRIKVGPVIKKRDSRIPFLHLSTPPDPEMESRILPEVQLLSHLEIDNPLQCPLQPHVINNLAYKFGTRKSRLKFEYQRFYVLSVKVHEDPLCDEEERTTSGLQERCHPVIVQYR